MTTPTSTPIPIPQKEEAADSSFWSIDHPCLHAIVQTGVNSEADFSSPSHKPESHSLVIELTSSHPVVQKILADLGPALQVLLPILLASLLAKGSPANQETRIV